MVKHVESVPSTHSAPLYSQWHHPYQCLQEPKKYWELECISKELEQAFDLGKGGNRPIRSCGTRWISHKRQALQRVVDRYGVYIAHLSTLAEDSSLKASDRAQWKGYLLKWKEPKRLVACCLYIDALKQMSILSHTLQSNATDIVNSMECILRAAKALQTLIEKDPSTWPMVELLKKSMKVVDGEWKYQGILVKDLDDLVDQCKVHVWKGSRK